MVSQPGLSSLAKLITVLVYLEQLTSVQKPQTRLGNHLRLLYVFKHRQGSSIGFQYTSISSYRKTTLDWVIGPS